MNFENPVVGDRDIINKMSQRAVLNNGDTITYALGQDVSRYKGINMVSHSGGDAGYRTFLGRFPDQKFSVIVFSNDASFNPGGLALKVADLYLHDEIVPEKKVEKKETTEIKVSVDIDTLKAYVGEYEIQPGFVLTITEEDGSLFGQATGQPKFGLKAVSTTEFSVEEVDAKITFHRDADLKINLLKLHQGGVSDARRMMPLDKSSVNLGEYVGQFHSDELSTEYTFIIKNDTLFATHPRLGDIKMTPTKADIFYGDAWFFGQTEFVRDRNGSVTGCKVSSGRVRNIWFKKVN